MLLAEWLLQRDHCLWLPRCGYKWLAGQWLLYEFSSEYVTTAGAAAAQSVLCLTTDWTTGFDPWHKQRIYPLARSEASYPLGTGDFSRDKTRPGRDADHSTPSSAEVKNEWQLYFLSPISPAWRVRDSFIFTFTQQWKPLKAVES
jgi:hypothetical protein